MIKKIKNKILKNKVTNYIISALIFLYVKLIEKTTHWSYDGEANILNELKGEGAILCSWHSRIAMLATYGNRGAKVNALVSAHGDGKIIAGLLKHFKFGIVSGSSNRNAKAAAVALMRKLESKESIAIIPDGPRGPAQKMTISPIYYASKTGCPIIASAYSTKKAIIIEKSWDKMMFPLPFSKGAFVFSDPFYVPQNASQEELEEYRAKFEKILNKVTKKADKMAERA